MPFKNLMSTKSSSHNYEFISITKQVIVILKIKWISWHFSSRCCSEGCNQKAHISILKKHKDARVPKVSHSVTTTGFRGQKLMRRSRSCTLVRKDFPKTKEWRPARSFSAIAMMIFKSPSTVKSKSVFKLRRDLKGFLPFCL